MTWGQALLTPQDPQAVTAPLLRKLVSRRIQISLQIRSGSLGIDCVRPKHPPRPPFKDNYVDLCRFLQLQVIALNVPRTWGLLGRLGYREAQQKHGVSLGAMRSHVRLWRQSMLSQHHLVVLYAKLISHFDETGIKS